MRVIEKVAPILTSLALSLSWLTLPTYADTINQDGLEISLDTDRESYSADEEIVAKLTVTNNNADNITDVILENIVPDGYVLANGTEAIKSIAELGKGETVSLEVVYVPSTTYTVVTDGSTNSSTTGSSTPSKDNSSNESGKGQTSTSDSSTSSTSKQTEPATSSTSVSSTSGKSEVTTTSEGNPQTGDDSKMVLAIATVAILSAVCALKTKGGKKMLSIVLTATMLGGSIGLHSIIVKAETETETDSSSADGSIVVSTDITVNGETFTLNGRVSYGGYYIEVVPSYGGTINTVGGIYKANSTLNLEATPNDGWVFLSWESTDGGAFADSNSSKTTFTTPNSATTVVGRFVQEDQIDMDDDELDVYLAYNALEIGYEYGDYAEAVTSKLTLPTSYEEDGHEVSITWSSTDETIVLPDGTVVRPTDSDRDISVVATLTKGNASKTKQFDIKVIKQSDIVASDIHDNTEDDLEALNEDAKYDLEVEYNDDGTQATLISGKYSTISVNSVDTALLSIYSVKSLIGLTDPSTELSVNVVNHDDYTLSYSFNQVYSGIPVYGRTVTVTARVNSGETTAIRSSVLANDVLSSMTLTPAIDVQSLNSSYNINSYELVIYSLDEYETAPTLAYVLNVGDEIVIVDANSAEVIKRFSTTEDWGDTGSLSDDISNYSTTGSGISELGKTVTFPVEYNVFMDRYYLKDVQRKITVYGDKSGWNSYKFNIPWGDKTANSAYTNVIKVYDWYKSRFDRNSLDNNGMAIRVNVHNYKNEIDSYGKLATDNAHWDPRYNEMCFFENSSSKYTTTSAAALDITAHEMTHAVFQYAIGQKYEWEFPYSGYTGSIDEGYSDVFGYFLDNDDWTIGEDWTLAKSKNKIRSVSDPESMGAPAKMSSSNYYTGDSSDILVHTNSAIVYHSAYLMSSYGISDSNLEKLWYNSMSKGYNATSDFVTVRQNLIQAGKDLDFSNEDLASIRRAFDDEEVYDELGSLELTYTHADDTLGPYQVQNANVVLTRTKNDVPQTEYQDDSGTTAGYTYDDIYFGTYELSVSVPGYKTVTQKIKINNGKTTSVNISLVSSVEGTLSGKVCKASDRTTPVESALVEVYQNDTLVDRVTSDTDGSYSVTLPVGSYKIVISADGYVSFNSYTTVQEDSVTYLETFLLVGESDAESGTASGKITDALTGTGLEDVTLTVRDGWNNTLFGDVVTTVSTDSNGNYSLTLPLGNYTLYATKSNYVANIVNIIVQEGETDAQNGALTPIVSSDTYRIVLTWGENPKDLDSHVEGKLSNGSAFHVYYSSKTKSDGGVKFCNLDVDDVTSYGPETITLTPTTNEPYYYYVHKYKGTGTVASSEAQVKVYLGDDLVRTFNVPTSLGDSDYWNVFAIKNGNIIVQNTITSSADTTYAD